MNRANEHWQRGGITIYLGGISAALIWFGSTKAGVMLFFVTFLIAWPLVRWAVERWWK